MHASSIIDVVMRIHSSFSTRSGCVAPLKTDSSPAIRPAGRPRREARRSRGRSRSPESSRRLLPGVDRSPWQNSSRHRRRHPCCSPLRRLLRSGCGRPVRDCRQSRRCRQRRRCHRPPCSRPYRPSVYRSRSQRRSRHRRRPVARALAAIPGSAAAARDDQRLAAVPNLGATTVSEAGPGRVAAIAATPETAG